MAGNAIVRSSMRALVGPGAIVLAGLGLIYLSRRPQTTGALHSTASLGSWHDLFKDVEWNTRSITAVVLTFTVSALANAAGIGGGGFLVPLFNLVLGLGLKSAMALSQAAITGGAVAAGIFALFNTHPLDDTKPLLDLDVALVLMPCLLIGVTLGVTMNQIFPNWVLVVVLSILLITLSAKTLRSGLRLHASEVQSSEENNQDLLITASSEIPNLSPKARRASREFEAGMEQLAENPEQGLMPATPLVSEQPALTVRPGQGSPLGDLAEGEASTVERLASHPVLIGSSNPSSLASSPRSDIAMQEAPGHAVQGDTFHSAKKGDLEHNDSIAAQAVTGRQDPSSRWTEESSEGTFHFQTPFQEASRSYASTHRQKKLKAHLWQTLELLLCIAIWAAFLALQLLRDRFLTCTKSYFAVYGAQCAFCLAISAAFLGIWGASHRRAASDTEAPLLPSPRPTAHRASPFKLTIAALVVLAGGAISALCGLGGGMVLGPVMLELGLHPLVTASTSLLLVGASSSSAALEFALANRLDYGWGLIMFGICVVASLTGVAGIGHVVRSNGKASIIVFLLVFVMAAGGILTAVFGGIHAWNSIRSGGRVGFISLCDL